MIAAMMTMSLLILIVVLIVASQVNGRQDLESYCFNFVNSSLGGSGCHNNCVTCFGPSADECFQCLVPGEGVEIEVGLLCEGTSVAQEVVVAIVMNTSVFNCSAGLGVAPTDSTSVQQIIIIAAAAGGGGVLVLCCLLILCCCCCCCYCRRRRRRKSFPLSDDSEDRNIMELAIVKESEHPRFTESSQETEFTMQPNLALFESTDVPPPPDLDPDKRFAALTPTPPPPVSTYLNINTVVKSFSSYEIRDRLMGASNPENAHSPSSLLADKGYIKMASSAVHDGQKSKSLRDLISDDDDDIYVEPDRTSAILPSPAPNTPTAPPMIMHTAPPTKKTVLPHTAKNHSKPATLPKPVTLSVLASNPQAQTTIKLTTESPGQGRLLDLHSPAAMPRLSPVSGSEAERRLLSSTVSTGTGEEESLEESHDYVSPQVFKQDLKQQQVENYYNKDAVLMHANAPRPAAVPPTSCDPDPQTIYANVDPHCPEESIDKLSSDDSSDTDKESLPYENVRDYLTGEEDEEGGDRNSTLYCDVGEANVNVCSLEEDNMYVYMKSGQKILADEERVKVTVPQAGPVSSKERHRLESEPLGKNKQYINYTCEQKLRSSQPAKVGKSSVDNITANGIKQKGANAIGARKENGVAAVGLDDQSDEAPLYVNCQDEEEELYTEVT